MSETDTTAAAVVPGLTERVEALEEKLERVIELMLGPRPLHNPDRKSVV